jgi:hypothetical protein
VCIVEPGGALGSRSPARTSADKNGAVITKTEIVVNTIIHFLRLFIVLTSLYFVVGISSLLTSLHPLHKKSRITKTYW